MEWHELPFMERLARMRNPWCILDRKERQDILDNMKSDIQYWNKPWGWNPEEWCLGYLGYLEGRYDLGP